MSYSRALASLANDPTLPPGLGPVSVFGGRLQSEGRDLRELFRCGLESHTSIMLPFVMLKPTRIPLVA